MDHKGFVRISCSYPRANAATVGVNNGVLKQSDHISEGVPFQKNLSVHLIQYSTQLSRRPCAVGRPRTGSKEQRRYLGTRRGPVVAAAGVSLLQE